MSARAERAWEALQAARRAYEANPSSYAALCRLEKAQRRFERYAGGAS